jgi:hypothetical protein
MSGLLAGCSGNQGKHADECWKYGENTAQKNKLKFSCVFKCFFVQ